MGEPTYKSVEEIKEFRRAVDALFKFGVESGESITAPTDYMLYATAQHEVFTKLQEAKMWAGKMLEGLGSSFPAELADKA